MKPIDLNLGDDFTVKGVLLDSTNRRAFWESSLEIDMPNGNTLSVEWNESVGRFVIVEFREYPENRIQIQYADTPSEVADCLRRIANRASRPATIAIFGCPSQAVVNLGDYVLFANMPFAGDVRQPSRSIDLQVLGDISSAIRIGQAPKARSEAGNTVDTKIALQAFGNITLVGNDPGYGWSVDAGAIQRELSNA